MRFLMCSAGMPGPDPSSGPLTWLACTGTGLSLRYYALDPGFHGASPAGRIGAGVSAGARGLVLAEGVDELGLGHGGAALDAELAGALDQVLLGPVGVGRALPALAAHLLARAPRDRVGDPGRLLLAVPLAAQCLVGLLVLDLGPGHGGPPFRQPPFRQPCPTPS